jgi:hypothetical protein
LLDVIAGIGCPQPCFIALPASCVNPRIAHFTHN